MKGLEILLQLPSDVVQNFELEVLKVYGRNGLTKKLGFEYTDFEQMVSKSFSPLHSIKGREYWNQILVGQLQLTI